MNINNSGKIPDMIKKAAAVAMILSITLCAGCVPSETSDQSGQSGYSEDNSTHVPVDNSSESGESSNFSENSGNSDGASSENGSVGGNSSDTSSSAESSGGITNSSEPSSTAESSVSETPPESSSVTSEPNSSPDPPPVVVVPDFPVPTSPGTSCTVSEYGAIDYSNASQGYISARYTGDKSRAKLVIKCGDKSPYNHDLSLNQTEYFSLPFGSGEYTVMIGEINPNGKYAIVLQETVTVNIDYSLSPFLYPNKYANYNKNSSCVYKAAEVCAGKSGSVEKIAAIFEWVTGNITYDHELSETVQTGYVPDPDRTFNSRKGICFDYASLMCAMLRSQSIPARLVIGYASPDIYHAWNEIYTEETGWITPELMMKKMGYNIADSTFYASAGDKSQIASYISNDANYRALYYY